MAKSGPSGAPSLFFRFDAKERQGLFHGLNDTPGEGQDDDEPDEDGFHGVVFSVQRLGLFGSLFHVIFGIDGTHQQIGHEADAEQGHHEVKNGIVGLFWRHGFFIGHREAIH